MAYPVVSEANRKRKQFIDLSDILPFHGQLKDGTRVVIDRLMIDDEADVNQIHALLNLAIEEGDTYPYEDQLNLDEFKAYYLCYDAFVMKTVADEGEHEKQKQQVVVGSTYIKPNFPGRSSHICNGGFLTMPEFRNRGAATLLAQLFIKLATKLGKFCLSLCFFFWSSSNLHFFSRLSWFILQLGLCHQRFLNSNLGAIRVQKGWSGSWSRKIASQQRLCRCLSVLLRFHQATVRSGGRGVQNEVLFFLKILK